MVHTYYGDDIVNEENILILKLRAILLVCNFVVDCFKAAGLKSP